MISNKETLKLKEMIICGRSQTVYHPREWPPYTFPQYLIDENPTKFEVVGGTTVKTPTSTVIEKTEGVEVKAINNVVVAPPIELPEPEKIDLGKPTTRKVRSKVTQND
jgi:hypothetical protein